MGCRTEPATVHIAHVLQRLHFFQFFNFFLIIYTTYRKKQLHALTAKKINFFLIHTIYGKKKLHALTAKNYTTRYTWIAVLSLPGIGFGPMGMSPPILANLHRWVAYEWRVPGFHVKTKHADTHSNGLSSLGEPKPQRSLAIR